MFENFRHSMPIQIRWGDMDALGHVNNAVYLTYLEQARVQYVLDNAMWDARAHEQGVIMARVVIDYRAALVAEDQIRVYSRISRLGSKSFDMHQLIVRETEDEPQVAAEATITVVVFDYVRQQTIPIPDAWRAKALDYEPGPIE